MILGIFSAVDVGVVDHSIGGAVARVGFGGVAAVARLEDVRSCEKR